MLRKIRKGERDDEDIANDEREDEENIIDVLIFERNDYSKIHFPYIP